MAELFIELFSEEIPAKLQIDARQKIKQIIDEKLRKKEINFNLLFLLAILYFNCLKLKLLIAQYLIRLKHCHYLNLQQSYNYYLKQNL